MKSPLSEMINKHGGGLFDYEFLTEYDLKTDPIYQRFLANQQRKREVERCILKKLHDLKLRDNEYRKTPRSTA